jgi:hypothetical protein
MEPVLGANVEGDVGRGRSKRFMFSEGAIAGACVVAGVLVVGERSSKIFRMFVGAADGILGCEVFSEGSSKSRRSLLALCTGTTGAVADGIGT